MIQVYTPRPLDELEAWSHRLSAGLRSPVREMYDEIKRTTGKPPLIELYGSHERGEPAVSDSVYYPGRRQLLTTISSIAWTPELVRETLWPSAVIEAITKPVTPEAQAMIDRVAAQLGLQGSVQGRTSSAPLGPPVGLLRTREDVHYILFQGARADMFMTPPTVAHEIGHIMLGHMALETIASDWNAKKEPLELMRGRELDADAFILKICAGDESNAQHRELAAIGFKDQPAELRTHPSLNLRAELIARGMQALRAQGVCPAPGDATAIDPPGATPSGTRAVVPHSP